MFRGSYVAIITPFSKTSRLDRKTLEQLVEWHIRAGTDGLVCCGSTGEGATLSEREKMLVADVCIQTAAQRIPIIVGTGTCDTRQSVRLTEKAQKLGARGCLVVTPYYNKPSQKGCLLHFQEVAKVGLPIVVYHNPGRTVVRLTAETVAEMSQIPGIVALKDSGHDLEWVRKVRSLCTLPLISGDDDITCAFLREGGVGAISVIGNLIPRGWKKMIHLSLEKKWGEAERLAGRYMPLCQALALATNPQCVKWAASHLKLNSAFLRLPLTIPDEATQAALKQELLRLHLPFSRGQIATGDGVNFSPRCLDK